MLSVGCANASDVKARPDSSVPLNDAQRAYVEWTEKTFASFLDHSEYAEISELSRRHLERKWIEMLAAGPSQKYYNAINQLATVRSKAAVRPLLKIAAERTRKDNRDRWMAVRALGLIGDTSVVPELIHLVYHYNQNTQVWAQISLVRLTGVNHASNWQQWGRWWNEHKGTPAFKSDKVTWTIDPEWTDEQKQQASDKQARQRIKKPRTTNETLGQSGSWIQGDCQIYGQIIALERNRRITHAQIRLRSSDHGTWVVGADFGGRFMFADLPAGTYSLTAFDAVGYVDTAYDPQQTGQVQPTFKLHPTQRIRSARIYMPLAAPLRRLQGRILTADGEPVLGVQGLAVYAWAEHQYGRTQGMCERLCSRKVNPMNGSFELEDLDGRPVLLQVRDGSYRPDKDRVMAPQFYPGTYCMDEAQWITFTDQQQLRAGMDIVLQREGGLVLSGRITDERGQGISQVLVSLFHKNLRYDLYYAYTDHQGRYRLPGLDKGPYMVHADAVFKGWVKSCKRLHLAPDQPESHLDFQLIKGAVISGRFVDESGATWSVQEKRGDIQAESRTWRGNASNFPYGNRYAPTHIQETSSLWSNEVEGHLPVCYLAFPTKDTFVASAVLPGRLDFDFRRVGARVLKILYGPQDITREDFFVESGQRIDTITVVVQTPVAARDASQ